MGGGSTGTVDGGLGVSSQLKDSILIAACLIRAGWPKQGILLTASTRLTEVGRAAFSPQDLEGDGRKQRWGYWGDWMMRSARTWSDFQRPLTSVVSWP
jgi:hypothetical protein